MSAKISFQQNSIEENKISVGKVNPIELPLVKYGDFVRNLGKQIGKGDLSDIFEAKNTKPLRVYKVILKKEFENGNEIRISKIAGNIGVAPAFHRAFVVKNFYFGQNSNVVVIEMDHAGETLGKLMKDFYKEKNKTKKCKKNDEIKKECNEEKKKLESILKEIQLSKPDTKFPPSFIEIQTPKRVTLEEAINKMYKGKKEIFYYELFKKIKKLAENKISYGDTHVGNIIPNYNAEKDFQLIDFDGAKLVKNIEKAAQETLESCYVFTHFKDFKELKNLSKKSKDLIKWFNDKNNSDLAKFLKKWGVNSISKLFEDPED
jgi:hypothetical protein